jgi:hypothetical protein
MHLQAKRRLPTNEMNDLLYSHLFRPSRGRQIKRPPQIDEYNKFDNRKRGRHIQLARECNDALTSPVVLEDAADLYDSDDDETTSFELAIVKDEPADQIK